MNEEEKELESKDHDPKIISSEDREIKEQKPPNDKIIYYKIVEDNKSKEF